MNEITSEEVEGLYEDIENLRQQISKLESVIAYLIHESAYRITYGNAAGAPMGVRSITSDRILQRKENSEKLIQEVGGARDFIDIFLNPPDNP